MLRGLSALALDSKGRVAIPARYREQLREACGGRLVVTVDLDRCLLIYPQPEWLDVEQRLVNLSSTKREARQLKRLLVGYAEECDMDGQGRILVSQPLRAFAGLDKRLVLVGQGNKFELWDEDRWNALSEELLADVSNGGLPVDLDISF